MRRGRSALILLALPALVQTACVAKNDWVRPDTSLAQRLADEKDCAAIASYQAFDESFRSSAIYPPLRETQFVPGGGGEDGDGGLVPSYSRRGAREHEIADYCMRRRGYDLRPVTR